MATKRKVAGRGRGRKRKQGPSRSKQPSWGRSRAIGAFAAMGGEQFATAVEELLRCEAREADLPVDRLVFYLAGNRGDGGVDAFLSEGAPRDSQLLQRPTVFQFKKSCPKASEVRKELKKGRARSLLQAGANYVLVVGADVPSEERAAALAEWLRKELPGWPGHALRLAAFPPDARREAARTPQTLRRGGKRAPAEVMALHGESRCRQVSIHTGGDQAVRRRRPRGSGVFR